MGQKVVAPRSWQHSRRRWVCIKLRSLFWRSVENFVCKSHGIPRNQEKTMTGSNDSHLAELHTKAAYAHEAAAHGHSTGEHASAQKLARKALEYSVEALKHTEEIAQSAPQTMQV